MKQLRRTAAAALVVLVGGVLMTGSAVAQSRGDQVRVTQFGRDAGPRLGLSVRDVTAADIERESLESARGAVVASVSDGSPADEGGIQAGDVVVEFDGEAVRGARQLSRLVQETPEGRPVGITVRRDGGRQELEVTPAERWASEDEWRPLEGLERLGEELGRRFEDFSVDVFPTNRTRLGIGAHALTPQLAEYFGVEEGVLVTDVADDSAASAAGLRAGDVITAIDERGVSDVRDLRRRLDRIAPGEEVPISITRDRESMALTATMTDGRTRGPRRRSRREILG